MDKLGKERILRLIRETTLAHLIEVGRNDYFVSTAVDAHPRTSYSTSKLSYDEMLSDEPITIGRDDYRPFVDIANEMGLSISGAKKIVDQAITKAKFINKMFPSQEERNAFILDVVHQYVQYLDSSDELDQDDLDLLYAHPEFVTELDGFNEFLMDELKDAGYRWEQGMK